MTTSYFDSSIQSTKGKILIADDELHEDLREGFLYRFGLPEKDSYFAQNLEEASLITQSETKIELWFLDYIIPKDGAGDYDYYWDALVIPFAKENNIKIVLYSAQADIEQLHKKKDLYPEIVIDVISKPAPLEEIEKVKKTLAQYGFLKTTEVVKIENLNNYYDYSVIEDEQKRQFIQQVASQLKIEKRKVLENIITIGNLLISVKEELDHGEYQKWYEQELGYNANFANRCTNIAQAAKSCSLQILNKMPLYLLYKVTGGTHKEQKLKMAAEWVEQGRTLTEDKVKEIQNQVKAFDSEANTIDINFEDITTIEDATTTKDITPEKSLSIKNQEKSTSASLSPLPPVPNLQIIQVEQKILNTCWKINDHYLVCGNLSQESLVKIFPAQFDCQIELLIGENFHRQSIRWNKNSHHLFKTPYTDISLEELLESVKLSIDLTTDAGQTVLLHCLYAPEIFELALKLECLCYAIEPNEELCRKVLDFSRNQGRVVTRYFSE